MDCSMPGFPVLHHLSEFSQTYVHWVGALLCLLSIFPSFRVFSSELAFCIKWPKYWSFSFIISPSDEYSVLILFWIDWLDLAVQGTFKSLLQHHSSKVSILQHLAFFIVQLSHPYMTTWGGNHNFDCINFCPSCWWCHQIISPSVTSCSSCPQSFPASGSFPMSKLFASSGQSIGASASARVLPVNIQGWFPLGLTGLIPLLSKGLPRDLSSTTIGKHKFLALSLYYGPTLTSAHDYWKNHSFDYMNLCWQSVVSAFQYTF